ncbi:MAG: sugar ABC transporter permease [Clostridiaceae bacterium]|nr:sugar ABC transporter permease [Clostridiaceae bacterium]
MLLPALVGFIIFQYIPSIGGFFVAFTNYNLVDGFFKSPFVGFKWFIQFVKDPFFFRLIRNTLLIGIYGFLWGYPAPIILALLMNEIKNKFFKRLTQTITYLPHFISTVIVVGMLYNFFGYTGLVNQVLKCLGMKSVAFVGNAKWFRTLYIGSGIWQGVGWGTILYLATLSGIDPQLYEAAIIDGAGRFKQALHVTLPGMAPVIVVTIILSVSGLLNVGFEKVYLMYSPAIYDVADVIATYVYRRGIEGMDFSFGGAVGLFNSFVSLVLLLMANYISRQVSENSLW